MLAVSHKLLLLYTGYPAITSQIYLVYLNVMPNFGQENIFHLVHPLPSPT